MNIALYISPCPNDTFMFDALVNGRIDCHGLDFDLHLADIEVLNRHAIEGTPDVGKISFGTYPLIAKEYQLLTAGSALGFGVGPLVVSKKPITPNELVNCIVALPGEHTTANLLFTSAFPGASRKKQVVFSEIEDMVVSGAVDAGVIIHETRFTYQNRGLHKVIDMGEWWEKKTGFPVPLGGIAIRRSLPALTKHLVNSLLRQSIEFAQNNRKTVMNFVQQHAQEMNPDVQKAHIELYVNKFSIHLCKDGQNAILNLFHSLLNDAPAGSPTFIEP